MYIYLPCVRVQRSLLSLGQLFIYLVCVAVGRNLVSCGKFRLGSYAFGCDKFASPSFQSSACVHVNVTSIRDQRRIRAPREVRQTKMPLIGIPIYHDVLIECGLCDKEING